MSTGYFIVSNNNNDAVFPRENTKYIKKKSYHDDGFEQEQNFFVQYSYITQSVQDFAKFCNDRCGQRRLISRQVFSKFVMHLAEWKSCALELAKFTCGKLFCVVFRREVCWETRPLSCARVRRT